MKRGRWWTSLYAQVWLGILAGVFVGHFFPKLGIALKPLGDAFIALIQMMIGPLVFGVLVQGIASMTDMKKLGCVGLKTLVYFFALSAVTLLIGILAAEVAKPGSGLSNAVGFAEHRRPLVTPHTPKSKTLRIGYCRLSRIPLSAPSLR